MSWLGVHLRSGRVSKVVYGSIIGLALVLTMEAHPPRLSAVVTTLIATAVAVGLAEIYSDWVGGRLQRVSGGEAEAEPWGEVVADAGSVVLGVAFPAVFFAAAWLGAIGEDTAYTVAKWAGLGLISFYGYVAGRLDHRGQLRSLLQASVVALIAAFVIVVKALVH